MDNESSKKGKIMVFSFFGGLLFSCCLENGWSVYMRGEIYGQVINPSEVGQVVVGW